VRYTDKTRYIAWFKAIYDIIFFETLWSKSQSAATAASTMITFLLSLNVYYFKGIEFTSNY